MGGQDKVNMANDLIIGMAGSGGDGIVFAGEVLVTAAALDGYHAVLTKSFGSNNPTNLVKAAMQALDTLRTRPEVERLRGVTLS